MLARSSVHAPHVSGVPCRFHSRSTHSTPCMRKEVVVVHDVTVSRLRHSDGVTLEAKTDLIRDLRLADVRSIACVRFDDVLSSRHPTQILKEVDLSDTNTQHWVQVESTKSLNAALAVKAKYISMYVSPSKVFSQAHGHLETIAGLKNLEAILLNLQDNPPYLVRGHIPCMTRCPFSGTVAPEEIAMVARAMLSKGVGLVSLIDTTGQAKPEEIHRLIGHLKERGVKPANLALNLRSTSPQISYQTINPKVVAGLEAGIRIFDTSLVNFGKRRDVPNASTLEVTLMMSHHGYHTGIDVEALDRARFRFMQAVTHL